jgi:hypothetical protein
LIAKEWLVQILESESNTGDSYDQSQSTKLQRSPSISLALIIPWIRSSLETTREEADSILRFPDENKVRVGQGTDVG